MSFYISLLKYSNLSSLVPYFSTFFICLISLFPASKSYADYKYPLIFWILTSLLYTALLHLFFSSSSFSSCCKRYQNLFFFFCSSISSYFFFLFLSSYSMLFIFSVFNIFFSFFNKFYEFLGILLYSTLIILV